MTGYSQFSNPCNRKPRHIGFKNSYYNGMSDRCFEYQIPAACEVQRLHQIDELEVNFFILYHMKLSENRKGKQKIKTTLLYSTVNYIFQQQINLVMVWKLISWKMKKFNWLEWERCAIIVYFDYYKDTWCNHAAMKWLFKRFDCYGIFFLFAKCI